MNQRKQCNDQRKPVEECHYEKIHLKPFDWKDEELIVVKRCSGKNDPVFL